MNVRVLFILMFVVSCGQVQKSQVDQFQSQGSGKKRQVVAEARLYERTIDGEKQRVTFIDMVHVAPRRYYRRVAAAIKTRYRRDKGLAVLLEGFYCTEGQQKYVMADYQSFSESVIVPSRKVTENSDNHDEKMKVLMRDHFDEYMEILNRYLSSMDNASFQREVDALYQKYYGEPEGAVEETAELAPLPQTVAEAKVYLSQPEVLQKLVEAGVVVKATCASVGSGKSISDAYSKIAKQYKMSTQSSQSLYPKRARLVNGDIDQSTLPQAHGVFFGLWSSCMGDESCSDSRFMSWLKSSSIYGQAAQQLINEVIIDKREEALFKTIKKELEAGTKTLIVPWGENHMPSYYRQLEALGFSFKSTYKFGIARCSSVNKNLFLEAVFKKYCH